MAQYISTSEANEFDPFESSIKMTELYIGLMSGTSADGIDAALVDFSQPQPKVVATHYTPYTEELRSKVLALSQSADNEIQRLGELDIVLGKEFALTVNNLLKNLPVNSGDIKAIGSHGQTIRHYPHTPNRFTMQIADPNTIAAETGITTVADFRRKDIAFGGQGAPLVPAFHLNVFGSEKANRAIVNIGGIANITLLSKKNPASIIGFDTGPGNVLLDMWINKHQNISYDSNGEWASKGNVHPQLLKRLLSDIYFQLPPPKSTGREHFNLDWLQKILQTLQVDIAPIDVQTTLVELTARTIISSIKNYLNDGELIICGGGVHNALLVERLHGLAQPHFGVDTTQKYGINPDWVEAVAFAWLARQTINRQPGNLPSVTGAKKTAVLGGIYYAG